MIHSHWCCPLLEYVLTCCTCVFHLVRISEATTVTWLPQSQKKSKTKLSLSVSLWANPVLLAVLAVWSLRETTLTLSQTAWVKESSQSSITIQKAEKVEGGGEKNPALFEHPLNGLPAPTSQTWTLPTHTHTHMRTPSNTHSIKPTHSHMATYKHTF